MIGLVESVKKEKHFGGFTEHVAPYHRCLWSQYIFSYIPYSYSIIILKFFPIPLTYYILSYKSLLQFSEICTLHYFILFFF